MKSAPLKGDRAKMLDNISFFEINMLRGPYYQEGFKIAYGLWDLQVRTKANTTAAVAQEEEEAYDDEF